MNEKLQTNGPLQSLGLLVFVFTPPQGLTFNCSNRVNQTKQLQIELDNLKMIRKMYFGNFKDQEHNNYPENYYFLSVFQRL